MEERQIAELLELNPNGVNLTYSVTADAAGQVTDRTVVCNLNVRDISGLRNGIFDYCDKYAMGSEV
jgi:hypothetical protein